MAGPRVIICGSSQDTASINKLSNELMKEGQYEVEYPEPRFMYSPPSQAQVSDFLVKSNYQWVIVVPPASMSTADPVWVFVDAALNLAAQRRIQGVLAVTDSSSYVPDNIIPDRWLTLRTYKALDNGRELDKLKRTLKYTRTQPSLPSNSGPLPRSLLPMPQGGTQLQNPRPPSQQRRIPLMAMIGVPLIVLLLLIAGGWIFFSGYHPSSSSAKPHATATALARLTATASSSTATATAQVTPTQTPDQLFTITTKKTPTLTDSAPGKQGDTNSWTSGPGSGCSFSSTDNTYQATVQGQSGTITPCMLTGKKFADFVYQVDMIIVSGDAGGIIFRSDANVATYYRFSVGVSTDGSGMVYRLNACHSCNNTSDRGVSSLASGPTTIQPPSNNNPQKYTLAVMVSQNTIYLFVNGAEVDSAIDATTSSGEIGVYAGSLGNQTVVAFSKVKVWKLP